MSLEALGMVETKGFIGAVEAADATRSLGELAGPGQSRGNPRRARATSRRRLATEFHPLRNAWKQLSRPRRSGETLLADKFPQPRVPASICRN